MNNLKEITNTIPSTIAFKKNKIISNNLNQVGKRLVN